jgi:hypothetical protein
MGSHPRRRTNHPAVFLWEPILGRNAFGSSGLERLVFNGCRCIVFFQKPGKNGLGAAARAWGGARAQSSRIYSGSGNYARFVSASRPTPTCQNPHVSKWSWPLGVGIAGAKCIFNMRVTCAVTCAATCAAACAAACAATGRP